MSRFNRTPGKTQLARKLRRDGTDVERRLWHRLRNGKIGNAHFRRQHPAGRYILDFYCPALADRDEWLKQRGVTVLRFWNSDVTGNLNGVLEVIAAKIEKLKSAPAHSLPNWRAERATDPHPASFARRPPPFRGR